MDMLALMFYGTICGALSMVSPQFTNPLVRISVGVVVGFIAASFLPIVRSWL